MDDHVEIKQAASQKPEVKRKPGRHLTLDEKLARVVAKREVIEEQEQKIRELIAERNDKICKRRLLQAGEIMLSVLEQSTQNKLELTEELLQKFKEFLCNQEARGRYFSKALGFEPKSEN